MSCLTSIPTDIWSPLAGALADVTCLLSTSQCPDGWGDRATTMSFIDVTNRIGKLQAWMNPLIKAQEKMSAKSEITKSDSKGVGMAEASYTTPSKKMSIKYGGTNSISKDAGMAESS
ncbi:hypothetical protein Tco_1431458 [Tanacetum coccineum]